MQQTLEDDYVLRLRLRLRLSQADFAKLVGVNQATVSKWETGTIAIGRWGRMTLERLNREITTRQQALKALKRLKREAA